MRNHKHFWEVNMGAFSLDFTWKTEKDSLLLKRTGHISHYEWRWQMLRFVGKTFHQKKLDVPWLTQSKTKVLFFRSLFHFEENPHISMWHCRIPSLRLFLGKKKWINTCTCFHLRLPLFSTFSLLSRNGLAFTTALGAREKNEQRCGNRKLAFMYLQFAVKSLWLRIPGILGGCLPTFSLLTLSFTSSVKISSPLLSFHRIPLKLNIPKLNSLSAKSSHS